MLEAAVQNQLGSRLTPKPRLRAEDFPSGGIFELRNLSHVPVEISWRCNPLQYLDLQVSDGKGSCVSEYFYGSLFSPNAKTFVLRLEPGESYCQSVDLLGNVPRSKLQAGTYTIKAVYCYGDLKAASDPIEVTLSEEDAKWLRYPAP